MSDSLKSKADSVFFSLSPQNSATDKELKQWIIRAAGSVKG